jgi:hypothetical protein
MAMEWFSLMMEGVFGGRGYVLFGTFGKPVPNSHAGGSNRSVVDFLGHLCLHNGVYDYWVLACKKEDQ